MKYLTSGTSFSKSRNLGNHDISDATFAFNAPVPPDRKCNKETGD